MVLVEGLALGIHQRIAGPGFRDQHHDRVGQRIAAGHQQLQRIVEARGVGLAVRDQRPHLVEVGAQQVRLQGAAARVHPVHVAADGVDLAVVGDEPIGVRQLPGGEGVGREPLVDHGQSRDGQRVDQVGVEGPHLAGQQQALVDHRPRRERRQVELGQARQVLLGGQLGQRVLQLLTDGQQLALEGVLVRGVGPAADEGLADHGHFRQHRGAQARCVDRHVAPADQRLLLHREEVLELVHRDLARLLVARHEAHGHGILARRGQNDALALGPVAVERIGDLDQDAGAVAHQRVGAHRAAMVEVHQDAQTRLDDLMGLAALDVGHEAHAARVMLVARVVQALPFQNVQARVSLQSRPPGNDPGGHCRGTRHWGEYSSAPPASIQT